MWQRLMAKALGKGVERFTFHDLRAMAAGKKKSLEAARSLLGHASSDTTKRHYMREGEEVEAAK
jgi:integrase